MGVGGREGWRDLWAGVQLEGCIAGMMEGRGRPAGREVHVHVIGWSREAGEGTANEFPMIMKVKIIN